MTIDLTPKELREWADLFSKPLHGEEFEQFDKLTARINPQQPTEVLEVAAPLALALADAMEERHKILLALGEVVAERDKALADLEAARVAIRVASKRVLKAKAGEPRQALWDLLKFFEQWSTQDPAVRDAREGG